MLIIVAINAVIPNPSLLFSLGPMVRSAVSRLLSYVARGVKMVGRH